VRSFFFVFYYVVYYLPLYFKQLTFSVKMCLRLTLFFFAFAKLRILFHSTKKKEEKITFKRNISSFSYFLSPKVAF